MEILIVSLAAYCDHGGPIYAAGAPCCCRQLSYLFITFSELTSANYTVATAEKYESITSHSFC
jgi:hypothetical protein